MAIGSLSIFVPCLCPKTSSSSSPRSVSSSNHCLPIICSALAEETWRNEPVSSVSPYAGNWGAAVSTALAAAVVLFGCSLPANAGVIEHGGAIGSAARLGFAELRSAIGDEKPCFAEHHLLEPRKMEGSLQETDLWMNLDSSSVSPEATASFSASILPRSNNTTEYPAVDLISGLVIADIDPATAKLAVGILGPSLSAFGFLFIIRIVMSWYPKLPVDEFPYVLAYAPTEPFLTVTRKVIPPLGGVDVTPVVWFGIVSFLNEILVGPQGLLVLLSQQVS